MAETITGLGALERRMTAVQGPLGSAITRRLGLATVREAKLLVHRRTGNLGRSIHVASATPTSVTVIASAGYAAYVELGTRPHDITPAVAKVLAWGGPRRLSGSLRSGAKPEFFAMRVHHPGSRPYPYLVPGAKIAVEGTGLKDLVIDVWNGAA